MGSGPWGLSGVLGQHEPGTSQAHVAHGSPSAPACMQPGPITRLTKLALRLEASRGVLGLFSGPQFPHLSQRGLGAPHKLSTPPRSAAEGPAPPQPPAGMCRGPVSPVPTAALRGPSAGTEQPQGPRLLSHSTTKGRARTRPRPSGSAAGGSGAGGLWPVLSTQGLLGSRACLSLPFVYFLWLPRASVALRGIFLAVCGILCYSAQAPRSSARASL